MADQSAVRLRFTTNIIERRLPLKELGVKPTTSVKRLLQNLIHQSILSCYKLL